jgi:YHS domain-containing protein
VIGFSSSCNNKSAKTDKTEMSASDKGAEKSGVNIKLSQLASKTDYSCKMTLENGAIADTTMYEGKIYGFCSTECKNDFLKDPKGHLEQK